MKSWFQPIEDAMSFTETDLLSLDVHTDNPYPFYEWLRDEEPLYWDPFSRS